MALRMLAILLIVAAAAGARWLGPASEAGRAPTAVVVAIDNSGSMAYRFQGRTHLAAGKQALRSLLASLPPGSQATVVTGLADEQAPAWRSGEAAAAVVEQVAQQPGYVSAGSLLRRARAALETAPLERRAIVLVNDRTAESWRGAGAADVDPSAPPALLDCWRGDNVNYSVERVELSDQTPSIGAAATLRATIRCGAESAPAEVELAVGERVVQRSRVRFAGPNSAATVEFTLAPEAPGPMQATVGLRGADPLADDDRRRAALEVLELPELLLVRDPGSVGRADPTATLTAQAVGDGRLVRRRMILGDAVDAEALAGAAVVVLADIEGFSESQWRLLSSWVRDGGRLWIAPGARVGGRGWSSPAAQELLGGALTGGRALASPVSLASQGPGEYAEPFEDPRNPPLSQTRIVRRLELPEAGEVVLRYTDGAPAAVERAVGAGRVLMWGFSPDPQWSNLARLAHWPVLVGRTSMVLAGADRPPLTMELGQSRPWRLPPRWRSAVVTLIGPEGRSRPSPVDRFTGAMTIDPDRVGFWRLRMAADDRVWTLPLAVNPPARESRLERLELEQIARRLGLAELPAPSLEAPTLAAEAIGRRRVDLTALAALLAAACFVGESFLANRFYRRGRPLTGGQETV
jgi:hypothetical protein